MSGELHLHCLDCRERRLGCHDLITCQAWAAYAAQATAIQQDTDHRMARWALLCGYSKELHERIERRMWNGR